MPHQSSKLKATRIVAIERDTHANAAQLQREGLAKEFTCLFCNHEKSVHVKLDKKAGVGHLSCAVCGQQFQCGIHTLMEAIDVYSEWVDAAGTLANLHPSGSGE